jgi:hypothetical protein
VIQLFADGKKVEDEERRLNSETGFYSVFDNLPVFYDESIQEIKYDVRAYIGGKYYPLPEQSFSNQTETVAKWMQITPEDITPGKTYLITTENLNYENNGFSHYVYMRGDVTAKGAAVETEYNQIDGKKTYYTIDGEPLENSRWVVTRVPEDDPNYNEFKDYYVFTNEEGKRLVLTGYNRNDGVNFQFKASSKDGFIESENANYTNKVQLIPVANSKSTFIIGSRNLVAEPYNEMQYIALSSQNQYQPTSDQNQATQFMIYEYIEKEISVATSTIVHTSLCEILDLPNIINPNTGYKILIIIGIAAFVGFIIYERYKKTKKRKQKS